MGIDAHSAKEFWLKYGHDDLLPREHLFRFFAHKLRILNVYLVDNGTERQLCVLEGGDQCAVHGFSSCA